MSLEKKEKVRNSVGCSFEALIARLPLLSLAQEILEAMDILGGFRGLARRGSASAIPDASGSVRGSYGESSKAMRVSSNLAPYAKKFKETRREARGLQVSGISKNFDDSKVLPETRDYSIK